MVTAACWAAREVHAGVYAAADAIAGLWQEFVTALAQPRAGQRLLNPEQARTEFARIWAWAVAQALTLTVEECRARITPMSAGQKIERAATAENGAPAGAQPPRSVLEFQTFADLAAEVDAAGARRWLIRGIWTSSGVSVRSPSTAGWSPRHCRSWSAPAPRDWATTLT